MNRIVGRVLSSGDLPSADKGYVAQVVARQTGLSPADAEKRVADVLSQAKSAQTQAAETAKKDADVARKAGIYVAFWIFISLLVGAFSASFIAALGGRHRDQLATASNEIAGTARLGAEQL